VIGGDPTSGARVAHGAQPASAPATPYVTAVTFGALDVVIGLHPLWSIVLVVALA
jgi:hypothetical protein